MNWFMTCHLFDFSQRLGLITIFGQTANRDLVVDFYLLPSPSPPPDGDSSPSALPWRPWRTLRRTLLCAGDRPATHHASPLRPCRSAPSSKRPSLCSAADGFLCFFVFVFFVSLLQMPNPIGFTATKELQEDPLHQEHEATRYAQRKVWRPTMPCSSP